MLLESDYILKFFTELLLISQNTTFFLVSEVARQVTIDRPGWGKERGIGNQHSGRGKRDGTEKKQVHELPLTHIRHSVVRRNTRLARDSHPLSLSRELALHGLRQKSLRRREHRALARAQLGIRLKPKTILIGT